jgi:putative transposase
LREGVGEDELTSIRAHLEQERALGDAKFQAMIEKALGRPVHVRHRGRPRRADRLLDEA